MNEFIRELTDQYNNNTHNHIHTHCHQENFDIPVLYETTLDIQPAKVKSFLAEEDQTEDIRSKLIKYNPSLSQYMNTTATKLYQQYPYPQYRTLNHNQNHSSDTQIQIKISPRNTPIVQQSQNSKQTLKDIIDPNFLHSPIQVIHEASEMESLSENFSQAKVRQYASSISDTRDMADTKFKKYFGKPCFANYGAYNTKMQNGGIVYGEYMKTHNVSPHKYGNHPATYQTYQSALLHANRTILSKNKDAQEVSRQIARKQRLQQQEKDRINGTSKSRNKQKLQKTSNTHLSNINKTKNNMSRSIISKQSVQEKDRHIAEHQQKNYENKLKYHYPDHHLVPLKDQHNISPKNINKQTIGRKINNKITSKVVSFPNAAQQVHMNHNIQHIQLQQQSQYQKQKKILVNQETQTSGAVQKVLLSPKLCKVKSEQSLATRKMGNNSSQANLVETGYYKVKQFQPILVTKQPPLRDEQPKSLKQQPTYEYRQQSMRPPYQFCICKHKQCQHKIKSKQIAYQEGLRDPDVADRIIACAKKAGMYNNYLPNMQQTADDNLNGSVQKLSKKYYEIPRERLNPQNYGCQQVEELQEIPYAGKPLRWNFNGK